MSKPRLETMSRQERRTYLVASTQELLARMDRELERRARLREEAGK